MIFPSTRRHVYNLLQKKTTKNTNRLIINLNYTNVYQRRHVNVLPKYKKACILSRSSIGLFCLLTMSLLPDFNLHACSIYMNHSAYATNKTDSNQFANISLLAIQN